MPSAIDAQTGEYGNLVSKGIIDPTKVVRVALQGAASIAGLLITTEAMVAELPKKQSPAMPGGPAEVWAEWAAWTSEALDWSLRRKKARARNPATLARDASELVRGSYRLTEITPVDQFRYAAHVEIVARLER